jgi:hypothetical protein
MGDAADLYRSPLFDLDADATAMAQPDWSHFGPDEQQEVDWESLVGVDAMPLGGATGMPLDVMPGARLFVWEATAGAYTLIAEQEYTLLWHVRGDALVRVLPPSADIGRLVRRLDVYSVWAATGPVEVHINAFESVWMACTQHSAGGPAAAGRPASQFARRFALHKDAWGHDPDPSWWATTLRRTASCATRWWSSPSASPWTTDDAADWG